MTMLSVRAKESIKTALAIVIAYAIAFELGWEKPFWAGFAVAMVSLDTSGASLNKAAMRMLGTFVACAIALTSFALFPQERWALVSCLSLYVGFCIYMVAGDRRQYFWFVSAFVTMVILVDAAPSESSSASTPLNAFRITVARVEETGMGILVYSLISAFLWPRSSRGDLEAASRDLSATQGELYRRYRGLMVGQGAAEESRPARLREVPLVTKVVQALNAAESDSYRVWELRRQWRRYQRLSSEVMETLERWRETFPQLQGVELSKPLPNLDPLCAELDRRFAEVANLLGGGAPERPPEVVTLEVDQAGARALGHFEKAAVAVAKAQLDRLEQLSRSLHHVVRDICGYGSATTAPPAEKSRKWSVQIDPDRLGAAGSTMATLWIGFLIWVYVDPPTDALFVFMATQWVMISILARQSVLALMPGFPIGIALGGVLYIFVMPHLSGYAQLGAMLFGVTFAIFYLCWAPQLRLMRSVLLALVQVFVSLSNQQSYDFTSYANSAAAILLSLALAAAVLYLLTSPRPEKAFLRLFRRFFRQADFMLSRLALDRDQGRGWVERWKLALYSGDLLALPRKLEVLGRRIDYAALPKDTPEKVQALVTELQGIAYRIRALMEARELPQAEMLVRQFHDDLRAWRQTAQEQVRLWADDMDKAVAQGVDMEGRLAARMARLDARMEETQRGAGVGALSEQGYENFFRYLGGLRGLSETGIGFIRLARTVDWARWREARF
jgi:uncharacterized membrane protein YccC